MRNRLTYRSKSIGILLASVLCCVGPTRFFGPLGGLGSTCRADEHVKRKEGEIVVANQTDDHAARLIPRQVLFGNPRRSAARLSPDGRHLSFLAPVDGVLNIWVAPRESPDAAKPITEDKERGIRMYEWAYDGKHILYVQDAKGDENWHVYATNVADRTTRDLTPIDGIQARIESVNERRPNQILVGINDRNEQLHDIYEIELDSGDRTLIFENPGFVAVMFDHDDTLRFAVTMTPTGGQLYLQPDDNSEQGWSPLFEISNEDAMTTGLAGFTKDNLSVYLMESRGRNTGALFEWNLQTDDKRLLAEDRLADVGGILSHPEEKTVQAVSFTYDRRKWKILDPTLQEHFDILEEIEDGELLVTSRTLDLRYSVVAYLLDDGPVKYYLYDAVTKQTTYLFSNRDDLDQYTLVKMHPRIITSRDNLKLVSYLSLPPGTDSDEDGIPDKPLPMVLDVHGGPWARDTWGYSAEHQWLANRGYAVLSVNFRGSTGFGKEFTNAGNGEWSGKMHNDLLDAVAWAVDHKIANGEQVAIMGGSYGGYATLVGLTFTPDTFACGVDIVGPSSLVTLLENVPPYWVPILPMMKDRVGDWTTESGRAELLARSPLTKVDAIQKPLLIAQGANDPRVKQAESDQIVSAMTQKQIPVTYVLYPDEGHGFARPENRISFHAVTEAFLAKHLGGRYEPIGDDFAGSSIEIPAGADQVPGLE